MLRSYSTESGNQKWFFEFLLNYIKFQNFSRKFRKIIHHEPSYIIRYFAIEENSFPSTFEIGESSRNFQKSRSTKNHCRTWIFDNLGFYWIENMTFIHFPVLASSKASSAWSSVYRCEISDLNSFSYRCEIAIVSGHVLRYRKTPRMSISFTYIKIIVGIKLEWNLPQHVW